MSTIIGNCLLAQYRSAIHGVVLMMALVAVGELAVAQQESARRGSNDRKPDAAARPKAVSSDRKSSKADVSDKDRVSAMQFASEHHPELARLLEQLEKSHPGEFSRAARELTQQIQALERVRERSPARYETQLEAWKRDSQIRVLMARWTRSQDPELEKQVRALLTERREARLAQLRAEQERLAEQLRKIEDQLTEVSQPIAVQIDKEWDQLSRKAAGRKSGDRKSSDRPASAEEAGSKP